MHLKLILHGWKTAEATRHGATFFSKRNADCIHVSIPSQWSNFFTVLLMSPDIYCWAKDFLTSRAVPLLGNENGMIDYFIPKDCPKQIICNSAYDSPLNSKDCKGKGIGEDLEVATPISQADTPTKKGSSTKIVSVVDTNLRRRSRLKQVSSGSKYQLVLIESVLPALPVLPPCQLSGPWELNYVR